jgi:hypothetical protein
MRIDPKLTTKCWLGSGEWLGRICSISSIAAKNKFWNAREGDTANNCHGANPFPSGRSKGQKSKTVSKGSNSTKNEKRASEAAVDAAASGSVEQTQGPHDTQGHGP